MVGLLILRSVDPGRNQSVENLAVSQSPPAEKETDNGWHLEQVDRSAVEHVVQNLRGPVEPRQKEPIHDVAVHNCDYCQGNQDWERRRVHHRYPHGREQVAIRVCYEEARTCV